MTKNNRKSLAMWLVIGVLGVLGVAGLTRAAGGFNWSNVEQKVAELLLGQVVSETPNAGEEVLGSGNPNRLPNGYWDTADGYYVDGTEVISNDGASVSLNSLKTTVVSGTFADATTTLACEASPFTSNTSTVDMVGVQITGVPTTSISLVVATSTLKTGLTTSTAGFGFSGPGQLINVNLLEWTTATNTMYYNGTVVDTRSNQTTATASRINVRADEYLCFVVGRGEGGSTTGVTTTNNLFDGTYKIRYTLEN